MLYFKALFEGLAAMPPADPAVRDAIDGRSRRARLARAARRTRAGRPRDRRRGWRPTMPSASSARSKCSACTGRPLSATSTREARHGVLPPHAAALAGAHRPRLAARAHRAPLRRHAGAGFLDEVQRAARARRPAPGPAQHALRRLPAGLGSAGRRLARWRNCASAASSPRASSPSASSPGCAACSARVIACDARRTLRAAREVLARGARERAAHERR